MRYPIVVEAGDETRAFGVAVPDLPGCFSAGDTLDEALVRAEEAAALWIDATLDAGGSIPTPSSLEAIREMPAYAGWALGVLTLDPGLLDDTTERVNITLPRRVLKRLDALAKAAGESRSGYIAQLTLEDRRRDGGVILRERPAGEDAYLGAVQETLGEWTSAKGKPLSSPPGSGRG